MTTSMMPERLQASDALPESAQPSRERIADQKSVDTSAERYQSVRALHLVKTLGMALALTVLFLIPQFLIHIPTGLIAPVSAGITTGGVRRVRPVESFIMGIVLFLVIAIPAPAAYIWFGFANHLPFIAIFVFSFVFAAYYGTLIGVSSWLGSKINQSKIGG